MGLLSFFRRENPAETAAIALYHSIVAQARSALFYSELGVPDSLNGRFDLIVIHAMLVMRRLRAEPQSEDDVTQALFDYMFKDMDRSLREVGVGDMSIGKHIKKMAKAFYGRAEEYENGMEQGDLPLAEALKRNLYRTSTPSTAQVAALGAYLLEADKALAGAASDAVMSGHLPWPAVRALA